MQADDHPLALLCDAAGTITGILIDPSGTARTGRPFIELTTASARAKALHLITPGRSAPADAVLEIGGHAIHVHAASAGAGCLLVGGASARTIEEVCADVSRLHPQYEAPSAQIAAAAVPPAVTGTLWNEISKLNNDLATAQRDLAKSNAHLRWLNEQKNQLLGMAAHDLRNPLAAILAYCQFILDDGRTLTDDQAMLVANIRESSDFMLVLIDDVLDLSAIESGTVNLKLEEFDVDQAVADVVAICGPMAARKEIGLLVQRGTAVPRLRADRGKVAQVLQNLVTNAVKFSMPGTRIVIETGAIVNTDVVIEVRDQGQGIPPKDLEKLFRPFSQLSVKSTAGESSSGLGLAIVKRLIEAHGGTISVTSTVGAGTTFRVVLPAHGTPRAT